MKPKAHGTIPHIHAPCNSVKNRPPLLLLALKVLLLLLGVCAAWTVEQKMPSGRPVRWTVSPHTFVCSSLTRRSTPTRGTGDTPLACGRQVAPLWPSGVTSHWCCCLSWLPAVIHWRHTLSCNMSEDVLLPLSCQPVALGSLSFV